MNSKRHDYLKRLPAEYYCGQAYVHWSLTMQDRKTGWLVPALYLKYREILTHTAFRYGLCCPIYCCMPDHIHMLWVGIQHHCDQRKAMRYFRRYLNPSLEKFQARFQSQAYDHVLRDLEREQSGFEEIAEYIARNPERQNLVTTDGFAKYPYIGCLVPGYPELDLFENGYWDKFWRFYSQLTKNGLQIEK